MTDQTKIFCTGLSRTGTTSLCHGLEMLEFKAKHFPIELFAQPHVINAPPFQAQLSRGIWKRLALYSELKAYRYHSYESAMQQFDVFADLPIPLYFRELHAVYPQAKFIHTTRDLDKWLSSMKWLLDTGREERGWSIGELADELHYAIYGCIKYDEPSLRAAYADHEANIHAYFSGIPDALLTINLDEGELSFERIAPFLNVATPDVLFPHSNSKD